MTEKETAHQIKKHVTSLLADNIEQIDIEKNINEIHRILQEATEITGSDSKMEHLAAVPTSRGKALGLNHAAQCLLDYKRTVKFLKAVFRAIQEKQEEQPNKTLHFFYAGCGPYAPFVNLIAPFFSSQELQFSLLEINSKSLESAKKGIQALGFSDHIQETYLADAVTFKVPNASTYDILFSETLDALLYRECYVPILFNLLPQFDKDTILIPENVSLSFKYLSYSQNETGEVSNYKEENAGEIFDVRKSLSELETGTNIPPELPANKFNFESMDSYTSVLIDTHVHIYKDILLHRGESSLTLPLEMKLQKPFVNTSVSFVYQLEPEIELKFVFE